MSDRAPSDCLLRSWMLRNIHEQKTNDEIRRFGVVHYQGKMTSDKALITAFEAILGRTINIKRCKDYENTSRERSLIAS